MRKGPNDYGGMWGQLQKLRNGKHPKTGKPLPEPTDSQGRPIEEHRRYARLDSRCEAANVLSIVPFDSTNRFTPYVPQPDKTPRPNDGRSAKVKMEEMLSRVKTREADGCKMYRLRGKQRPQNKDHVAIDPDDQAGSEHVARTICWATRKRVEITSG